MSVSVSISIYGDSMSLYGHILMTSGSECSQYIEILTDSDITNILTSKLEGVEPTVCSVAADNYHRCLIFSRHNITSIQTVAGGGFLTYDVCFAMFLTSGFVFIRYKYNYDSQQENFFPPRYCP